MMTNTANKRYYWIKLKTDFFNQETIDFLLSQKNGCQYVVLYQMLCLNTANNDGMLASTVGEMLVPYDVNKIMRDTKYFDFDTVTVALELFKKLGLIYEELDNVLKITGYEDMVGSETDSAKKIREWREKKKLQCNENVTHNVTQEYRDKSIEYRDKNIDIRDKSIEKDSTNKAKRFIKPTIEEVQAYILENNLNVNSTYWYDYYESNGWKVGRNPMKDWKACIRRWNKTEMKNHIKENREKVTSNPFLEILMEEKETE
jgi:predicted phage replisome organizer